jgi:hypothetical protein
MPDEKAAVVATHPALGRLNVPVTLRYRLAE